MKTKYQTAYEAAQAGGMTAGECHEFATDQSTRMTKNLCEVIRPGDRVTILVPAGIGRFGQEFKEKTGRAVMRGQAGWVLNMGGRFGTPGIAGENNTVKVVPHSNNRK